MEPCEGYILTIDHGNSSAKAAVWHGEEVVESIRVTDLSIESFLPLFERYELSGAAFCSVAGSDAKFLETLRRMVDGRLSVLTPTHPVPLEINYASRGSLGADRIGAALGAAALFPRESLLVVDAGTALTLDIVSSEHVFEGGNIAPGINLRLQSLHQFTTRLPLVDPSGALPDFGHDTETAIRCGVVRGMVAEIADMFETGHKLYGCSRIVLTGADAPLLLPLIQMRGISAVEDAHLVGRGLRETFVYDNMIF